jgi:uncharacterized protein YraI
MVVVEVCWMGVVSMAVMMSGGRWWKVGDFTSITDNHDILAS